MDTVGVELRGLGQRWSCQSQLSVQSPLLLIQELDRFTMEALLLENVSEK